MKNIVAKNIKYLFQIYCVEIIFMDNKYIFVPYEGIFETNIFLKGIFDANIFLKGIFYANICAKGEKKKKRIFSMISVLNLCKL